MRIYGPTKRREGSPGRGFAQSRLSTLISDAAEELAEIENVIQRTLYQQRLRADALRKVMTAR